MAYVNVILEAKQSITNLGFPEIISTLFYEKYGKAAFVLARWYKEYTAYGSLENSKNWWNEISHSFKKPDTEQLTKYYQATKAFAAGTMTLEEYNKIRDRLDLLDYNPAEADANEILQSLKNEIAETFFSEVFFSRNLVKAIGTNKVSVQPYSKLPFAQANQKYEEKTMFDDKPPIKTYSNGWRWIDAGAKCDLVGSKMKNCGSTGVMSGDKNRTMLTLFDPNNNPHVVATYSPNEKRLSGIEGQAGTAVKLEYVDYVIDLIKTLGVEFDAHNSKSKALKLKYLLNPKSLVQIPGKSDFDEFFEVELQSGETYYTDSYTLVSKPRTDALALEPANAPLFDKLSKVFNHNYKDDIRYDNPGFEYLKLQQVASMAALKESIRKMVRQMLKEFHHI